SALFYIPFLPREDAMRRRDLSRTAVYLGILLALGLGLLGWLLRHEPASYRSITVPEGGQRRKLSGEFASSVARLLDDFGSRSEEQWSGIFTADQMNSYFEEDFVRVKPFKLPVGVNSPRVAIKPGHLQIAFRYGEGFWSSVVTVELNLWLVASEP